MTKRASIPTRVTADVAATAASVGHAEHRTATEQINYWARIGMQVERSTSLAGRTLLAVVAGDAQFTSLDPRERTVAHALIDARAAERVAERRFGDAARRAGQVTASIDDDGTVVEVAADGSRRPL